MKTCFLILAFLTSLSGICQPGLQQKFVLTGHIAGRDTGIIELSYLNTMGQWVIDTAILRKGMFEFEGYISEPTKVTLKGNKKVIDFNEVNIVSIFLEPGLQQVDLMEDNYADAKVSGSKTQAENEIYIHQIDSISRKYRPFEKLLINAKYEVENASTPEEKERALKKENEISKSLSQRYSESVGVGIRFLLNHPDSYVSPQFLYQAANLVPIDSVIILFKTLTPRVKNSAIGKYINSFLRKIEQNTIGKPAYNFVARKSDGDSLSLSQFYGKYVLLDFWASWCIPCIEEIPATQALYRKYHLKGFEVITISIDEDVTSWLKAIEKYKMGKWYNVLSNEEIANNYPNVTKPIPSGILIAPDGRIIWNSAESETLELVLSSVFTSLKE